MASSDRTCLQLRQYLTTMQATDPAFGPQAGRKMMQTLFLSNWQHERNGHIASDEVKIRKDPDEKKGEEFSRRGRGVPSYKRRRLRGGAVATGRRGAELNEL